jgi:hypothetical protein
VAYKSPLFEVNALASAGLPAVPFDWRRGDLLIFRKQDSLHVARPTVPELDSPWTEYRIGCLRWWVRGGGDTSASTRLRTVWKNSILPSVSSRFPGRHSANVVTSGNRFFRCDCPDWITEFCAKFSSQEDRLHFFKKTTDSTRGGAPLRLARLLAGEAREAAEYSVETYGL